MGLLWEWHLGMSGAILSAQKEACHCRRPDENQRYRIQTHTRDKRTNFQLIEFNQKEIQGLE